MRLLELFSGTGSVGMAFRKRGWEVHSLDIAQLPGAEPLTFQRDVRSWQPQGHYDVVWASVPCTQYSRARTIAKEPRDLEGADELVATARGIIDQAQPRYWFIENPQTGLLKGREVVADLPFRDVSYCAYGLPYRKTTRIWSNAATDPAWETHSCPGPGLCWAMEGKRHRAIAQRGPGRYTEGGWSREHLHRIPEALCDSVAEYCGLNMATPGSSLALGLEDATLQL